VRRSQRSVLSSRNVRGEIGEFGKFSQRDYVRVLTKRKVKTRYRCENSKTSRVLLDYSRFLELGSIRTTARGNSRATVPLALLYPPPSFRGVERKSPETQRSLIAITIAFYPAGIPGRRESTRSLARASLWIPFPASCRHGFI